MASAIASSYIFFSIYFLKPIKIATYNVFGFKEDEALWEGFGNVFFCWKNGELDALSVLDGVGDFLFLFF
jgi:hypothetical protein